MTARRKIPALLSLCAWLLLISPLTAQEIEYDLTPLPMTPEAFSNVAVGLNDLGEVVGWNLTTGVGLRPWHWSAETGLTILPPAPGQDQNRANDINNSGVIAGDGGFDSGLAWRLMDGLFEIIPPQPQHSITTAAGINEDGDITGSSRTGTITIPPSTYLAVDGGGLFEILDDSQAGYLNDSRQVTGWTGSLEAFRFTPGVGVELLGPLGSKPSTFGFGINGGGDVVGLAQQANGNGEVPFLFTDAFGIEELGDLGGEAGASSVNDLGEVIGNFDPGVNQSWIWTRDRGLRFLGPITGESDGVRIFEVRKINDVGQILGTGTDTIQGGFVPVLLTPVALRGREEAALGALAVRRGTLLGGDLAELTDSDNEYLLVGSESGGGGDRAELMVGAVTPATTPSRLDLAIETGADVEGVSARIQLRNQQTGAWETVDSFAVHPADRTEVLLALDDPELYVNPANGRLQVRVRAGGGGSFELRIDRIEALVTP